MHKDYYCAYHHTQIITSFCRCPECLLPACPSCVRLHSEQHTINKTKPEYEKLANIFREINSELTEVEGKVKSLGRSLLLIEKNRKEDMKQLRAMINAKGKELINSFQEALNDLDRRIVAALNEMDTDFIREIQSIDDEVLGLEKWIEREKCGIQSEESLKTIISFYEEKKKDEFKNGIQALDMKIAHFAGKRIYTTFKKDFKEKISDLLSNFISISQVGDEN